MSTSAQAVSRGAQRAPALLSRRTFLTTTGLATTGLALGAGLSVGLPMPAHAAAVGQRLLPGEALRPLQSLESAAGRYQLIYQADGNLVLYEGGGRPIWATMTNGRSAGQFVFQRDGNAVVYDATGSPVWAAASNGTDRIEFRLQDDGNLVINTPSGRQPWTSRTDHAPANPVASSIPAQFAGLPRQGRVVSRASRADTGIYAHIQGVAMYQRWALFTHNRQSSAGYWVVNDTETGKSASFDITTPEGFKHPSGFQVIGDFAAVGIERDDEDNSTGLVNFYDLRHLAAGGAPELLSNVNIRRSGGGAACVGIVRTRGSYVLAVYTTKDALIHMYRSNAYVLGDPRLRWTDLGWSFSGRGKTSDASNASLVDVGYDNLNLQTDLSGQVFLIGMRSEDNHVDWADLMQIDVEARQARSLGSRHFYTDTRGRGTLGAHFRWGAGTQVLSTGSLLVFCSPRLFAPSGSQVNYFG